MEKLAREKVSDSQLVEAFRRRGDERAFCKLVALYTERVHNLGLRITRSEEDAEEILQEVFITIYRKIDKFQGKSAFSSWLYRITANAAFMKLRKRKKHAAVPLEDAESQVDDSCFSRRSDTSDIDYLSARHELRAALERAIDRLPGDYRMIFMLRDVDGLSNQEVGEILNLSVPAIKSRLHRSRLMLRKRLQKFHDDYVNNDTIYYGPKAPKGELPIACAA